MGVPLEQSLVLIAVVPEHWLNVQEEQGEAEPKIVSALLVQIVRPRRPQMTRLEHPATKTYCDCRQNEVEQDQTVVVRLEDGPGDNRRPCFFGACCD